MEGGVAEAGDDVEASVDEGGTQEGALGLGGEG
jgi:hypothetical protein